MFAVAWVAGLGFLAYFMLRPMHDYTTVVVILVVNTLLCSPFTLRTPAGRLWWMVYTLAVLSAMGAVMSGGQNAIGWLLATLATSLYSLGVCLRWHPPSA
jgi:hypothetical protein